MTVTFLLESTAISSRTKTVLAYADALTVRGFATRIVTADAPLSWRASRAEWIFVDELAGYVPAADERVVATSRELVERFDGAAQILFGGETPEEVAPVGRKLAVSRSAVEAARDHAVNAVYAGPVVDDEYFRSAARSEHEPLRLVLAGASQNEHDGTEDGYGAVTHARWFHQQVDLVRSSPWAPSREEPLDSVQEFHVGLSARENARLLLSCDVAVVPFRSEAGFALEALEAIAAGVAVVMTATPFQRSLADSADYALFAPERNAVELGEKLVELLENDELRARLREQGRAVAQEWRGEVAGDRLAGFFTTETQR